MHSHALRVFGIGRDPDESDGIYKAQSNDTSLDGSESFNYIKQLMSIAIIFLFWVLWLEQESVIQFLKFIYLIGV